MVAKSRGLSVNFVEDVSGLFNATARSFEQEAQRITRQTQARGLRTSNKRANGR